MKEVTLQTYRERLQQVILHIQENLNEELSLDELAEISCFSPFHFHRIFRAIVGNSVHQHVRRLRLERAAHLLRQTKTRIVQLALDAGYETHESFTRAFKSEYGLTPSEFRSKAMRPTTRADWGRYDIWKAEHDANLKVDIKTLPTRRIAFVRHVGPYSAVGTAFDTLLSWAAPRGLLGGRDIEILGVCYDHPELTPLDRIRYDAALVVDEDVGAEGEIDVRELPGGDHAVVCHEGPYQELNKTYGYIYGRWLPTSGRLPADSPPFEVYLNDPDSSEPEELLTDLYIPLENIPDNR